MGIAMSEAASVSYPLPEYNRVLPTLCVGCGRATKSGGGCDAASAWVFGTRDFPDPFVWQHVDDVFAAKLESRRLASPSAQRWRRRREILPWQDKTSSTGNRRGESGEEEGIAIQCLVVGRIFQVTGWGWTWTGFARKRYLTEWRSLENLARGESVEVSIGRSAMWAGNSNRGLVLGQADGARKSFHEADRRSVSRKVGLKGTIA